MLDRRAYSFLHAGLPATPMITAMRSEALTASTVSDEHSAQSAHADCLSNAGNMAIVGLPNQCISVPFWMNCPLGIQLVAGTVVETSTSHTVTSALMTILLGTEISRCQLTFWLILQSAPDQIGGTSAGLQPNGQHPRRTLSVRRGRQVTQVAQCCSLQWNGSNEA